MGEALVVMHGHRHIDWIGACGSLRIISAPSPVMEATDDEPDQLPHPHAWRPARKAARLLAPERIEIAGAPAWQLMRLP